jgi:hypothetical protein
MRQPVQNKQHEAGHEPPWVPDSRAFKQARSASWPGGPLGPTASPGDGPPASTVPGRGTVTAEAHWQRPGPAPPE